MHNVTAFHIFAQFRLLSWYARLRLPEHKKKLLKIREMNGNLQ